ncbi:MAG: PEP-CTERM sorting domain-containing protein [Thermoguttaceae bacterium]|nr:PEP-CTERM sorting domain-containing protein [Thermoguttaceae bacterium]MDW8036669.1 PEP-CTERM sorting domain-containing protein [Thermoguttaceae bacterium]
MSGIQVQYLRQAASGIFEPDRLVLEFYRDSAYTQLVQSFNITGFSGTDGVFHLAYAFAPVSADYARLKFYNDQEWTWLGEVMFFGSVPEPSTWAMMVLGALGLAAVRLFRGRGKS